MAWKALIKLKELQRYMGRQFPLTLPSPQRRWNKQSTPGGSLIFHPIPSLPRAVASAFGARGGFPGLAAIDFFAGALIDMRVQHSYKRQIAISLGKVQSVPHHKEIRYFKTHVVGFHILDAARGLVEQNACFDAARL